MFFPASFFSTSFNMQLVTIVCAAALLSNTAFAVPQNLEKKSPVSSNDIFYPAVTD